MSENKTDIPSELTKAEQSSKGKKIREAQAEQMYGKAADHAPSTPTRADFTEDGKLPSGAPPAQGPNISKEEAEFAANGGDVAEEKTPASTEVK